MGEPYTSPPAPADHLLCVVCGEKRIGVKVPGGACSICEVKQRAAERTAPSRV